MLHFILVIVMPAVEIDVYCHLSCASLLSLGSETESEKKKNRSNYNIMCLPNIVSSQQQLS